jgi:hypothetical protein
MRDEGTLDEKHEPGAPPENAAMVTFVAQNLFRVAQPNQKPIAWSDRLKVVMVNQEIGHNVSVGTLSSDIDRH